MKTLSLEIESLRQLSGAELATSRGGLLSNESLGTLQNQQMGSFRRPPPPIR